MAATLKASQMAEQVDLSPDTLRYRERVAPGLVHRASVVARIAELQHDLEQLDGKLTISADTFGVTARRPIP